MKIIDWNALNAAQRAETLARPTQECSGAIGAAVRRIIEQVRADGDSTLRALTRRFDDCELASFEVSTAEFAAANAALAPEVKQAIVEAAARIERFHRLTTPPELRMETAPGVVCERILRPIERVGLYVPGGSASLPSTVLMLAIPARIAQCQEIILCTPPRADGGVDAGVLVAAAHCGVTRVLKLGGAQAIAAMAYGSASVPKCDKLFGPGNAYVTEAKLQVAQDPAGAAIDMPAGPSEVLVIADAQANPRFVAADLLAQAEHGKDSQVVLVSPFATMIQAVAVAIEDQLQTLPRADIARAALAHSRLIVARDLPQCCEINNAYAPEHLILNVDDPRRWLASIRHAGSIFLGGWSPETVGDYCSGANHVLPTYGYARTYSGVSVASFVRQITVQELSAAGLRAIGPCAATLAISERLDAHARAVTLRLESLQ